MITRAKLEALRLLAVGPCLTSKHTTNGMIAGRVVACLVREGLATRATPWTATITDAGREALARSEES